MTKLYSILQEKFKFILLSHLTFHVNLLCISKLDVDCVWQMWQQI